MWVWYLVITAEHVWINMSCSSPLQPPLLLSFYPFFWDVACVLGGRRHSAKKQDTRMGKVFTSLYQTSHDCTDQRKNLKKLNTKRNCPLNVEVWLHVCSFWCSYETQSHSELYVPPELTIFLPHFLLWSQSLSCGCCVVDVATETSLCSKEIIS